MEELKSAQTIARTISMGKAENIEQLNDTADCANPSSSLGLKAIPRVLPSVWGGGSDQSEGVAGLTGAQLDDLAHRQHRGQLKPSELSYMDALSTAESLADQVSILKRQVSAAWDARCDALSVRQEPCAWNSPMKRVNQEAYNDAERAHSDIQKLHNEAEAAAREANKVVAQAKAALDRERWIAQLTPEDVPGLLSKELADLPPALLQHVTADQLSRLGEKGREAFTDEQDKAIAETLYEAEVIEEAKQAEQEKKAKEAEDKRKLEALKKLRAVCGSGSANGPIKPRAMFIVGWFLMGGVNLFYGDSKVGKSTLLRALLLAFARYESIFPSLALGGDRDEDHRDAAIVMLGEDTSGDYMSGTNEQAALIPGGENVRHVELVPTKGPLMVESPGGGWEDSELLGHIEEMIVVLNASVLVVDHLSTIASNMDIEKAKDMRPLMARLSRMGAEYNIAVIVVHHCANMDKANWPNKKSAAQPYGSVVLKHESRSVVRIQKKVTKKDAPDAGRIELIHEHINYGPCHPEKPAVEFERVGAALREVEPIAKVEDSPDAQEADKKAPETAKAVSSEAIIKHVISWLDDSPNVRVTLGALKQGRGENAKQLLGSVRTSIPSAKNGVIEQAVKYAIASGVIVERAVHREDNNRLENVLAIPTTAEANQ